MVSFVVFFQSCHMTILGVFEMLSAFVLQINNEFGIPTNLRMNQCRQAQVVTVKYHCIHYCWKHYQSISNSINCFFL